MEIIERDIEKMFYTKDSFGRRMRCRLWGIKTKYGSVFWNPCSEYDGVLFHAFNPKAILYAVRNYILYMNGDPVAEWIANSVLSTDYDIAQKCTINAIYTPDQLIRLSKPYSSKDKWYVGLDSKGKIVAYDSNGTYHGKML